MIGEIILFQLLQIVRELLDSKRIGRCITFM